MDKMISVVMVNYNSGPLLKNSLQLIFKKGGPDKIETIVIDNDSKDSSLTEAKKLFPGVTYLANNANLGFSKAINQGIKSAKGNFILLLNPDTLIDIEAVGTMADFLEKTTEGGIVGPQLLNVDGSVQLSCRSFPGISNAIFNRYSPLTRLFPKNRFSQKYLFTRWGHDQHRQVDWVSGACLMIKKSVLDRIGLLDEDYFMYCEDIDLCLRAGKTGWKTYYLPQIKAVHHIRNGKKRASLKSIVDHHISMYLFFKKHRTNNRFALNLLAGMGMIFSTFFMVFYKKIIPAE